MSTATKSSDPFTSGWIEDDLYYRGETPPQDKRWHDDDWVYIPHENYIPVSKSRIIQGISAELNEHSSSEEFKHLIELLEGIYHFHYHKVLNELKEDYEYFSPSMGEEMRSGVDAEELKRREQNFLLNFVHLMIRGNFNPLGEAEHQQADAHSYLLDLPIDVNWDIKDPTVFQQLFNYSESPEGQRDIEDRLGVDSLRRYLDLPKDFDERIMIFHRGISPARTEGLFFMQKINCAVDRLFETILSPLQKQVKTVTDKTESLVEGTLERGKSLLAGRPFAPRTLNEQEDEVASGDVGDSTVFLPRWLRRTSLQNQPTTLKSLYTPSLLQEPAIERVIAVFRLYPPSPPAFLQRIPIVNRFIKMPPPEATDPTLHVKLFQHIPLADLEIIFPEKKIRMKSFDKFMLGFLGVIGIIVGVSKGMSSGKGAVAVVFSVLALLAMKTITRFLNTRRRYMLQMSQDLYHKNLDNDVGVIQYLVDNIEDQEFKEAFIAYTLLLKAGRPLTAEELDGEAERFLNTHFSGLEVDFEVDDALDKVTVQLDEQGQEKETEAQRTSTLFLPLVHELNDSDGETRYRAKSLKDALSAMDHRWDNFFDY